MIKKKKSILTQEFSISIFYPYLKALATISTLALLLFIYTMYNGINAYMDQANENALQNWYDTQRITFCYDNEIKPCSDEKIIDWNNTHPDEIFATSK